MEPTLDIQEKKNQAADKIQKLWRSYTNRKIYKYYRDIIFFKCKYISLQTEAIPLNYSKESILLKHNYYKPQSIVTLGSDQEETLFHLIFTTKYLANRMSVISTLLHRGIILHFLEKWVNSRKSNSRHINSIESNTKMKDGT